jgi:hypothetical protein
MAPGPISLRHFVVPARKFSAGSLKKYLTSRSPSQEGALLQAPTAQEWAELKFNFSDSIPSIFVFEGKTYGAWLKTAKGKSDEGPSVSTKLICSAELQILETMVEENQGEKNFAYRIEIREKKKKPEIINLKAEDLVGPKELRKGLMKRGNLVITPELCLFLLRPFTLVGLGDDTLDMGFVEFDRLGQILCPQWQSVRYRFP